MQKVFKNRFYLLMFAFGMPLLAQSPVPSPDEVLNLKRNPLGYFEAHWITSSGGNYYDPSYGTPAIKGGNADGKYEDEVFAGFSGERVTEQGLTQGEVTTNPMGDVELFLQGESNDMDVTLSKEVGFLMNNK